MRKIVICGGHLSPALAIIEKLRKNKTFQIYYFGRKNALEGDRAESLEYKTIKNLQIPFYNIVSGRIQRSFTRYSILSLSKFPIGIITSLILLMRLKPKLVLSFGGYISLPVCISAWILGKPIITHEQTHSLGFANKIIFGIAKVNCLSYKDTSGIPFDRNTVLTGNPIRESMTTNNHEQIIDFGDKNLPLIYITGGNLGSRVINETIEKIIPDLTSKYRILHQCGNADSEYDYNRLLQKKNSLPIKSNNNYIVKKQIDPSFVGTIYRNASLVIGRAGANTVNEILFFGVPVILIPLPWAGSNEQETNALSVEARGIGEIILQKMLTAEILLRKINSMIEKNDKKRKQTMTQNNEVTLAAADKIVNLIQKYACISK